MQVIVNGKPVESNGTSVAELVEQLSLGGKRIAIELNQEILPKSRYADTPLKAGDQLEIIHAIGGG